MNYLGFKDVGSRGNGAKTGQMVRFQQVTENVSYEYINVPIIVLFLENMVS